jgi:hypothetical protein
MKASIIMFFFEVESPHPELNDSFTPRTPHTVTEVGGGWQGPESLQENFF